MVRYEPKADYRHVPTSISLPPKIVRKLDFVTSKKLFPNRSALILHYILEGFKREKLFLDWLADTEEYKLEPIELGEGCLVDRQSKQVYLGTEWNAKRMIENV